MKDLPLSDAMLVHFSLRLEPVQRAPSPTIDIVLPEFEALRAGLLPFIAKDGGSDFVYYVMKPRPRHLESKGQPLFQIAKGTRHYQAQDAHGGPQWLDLKTVSPEHARGKKLEPLLRTALREGAEEIALEPFAIEAILDFGPVAFRSETKATEKSMWLYLAQFADESSLPPLPRDHETEEARWCSLEEFRRIGRPDHLMILTEVEKALAAREKSKAAKHRA